MSSTLDNESLAVDRFGSPVITGTVSELRVEPIDVLREEMDEELEDEEEGDSSWFSGENYALITSMLLHVIAVLLLALLPAMVDVEEPPVVLVSLPPELDTELVQQIDEVVYNDDVPTDTGAAGFAAAEVAAASAVEQAPITEIPNPIDQQPQELATLNINELFTPPKAPLNQQIKANGTVGQAIDGATGAVDRLTFEILKSLEERPTLVVWLFDQSGSLSRQRQEIRDRFDRIYEELGVIQQSGSGAFAAKNDKSPLLTSIMGFGESTQLLTKEPTDDLELIKSTVDQIENDPSGIERAFAAVYAAAMQYKDLRRNRAMLGPERNVLLIVVTDERGDDAAGLETTINLCRKHGMPVYVIGVPAPFGQEHTLIKYVDPDPQYDQTPRFAQVDQGPESMLPERVQIGYVGDFEREPVIDSGFGPYALTRLAYETGGIFFNVHPNRNLRRRVSQDELSPFAAAIDYFADPEIMGRYRPDYVSAKDYEAQVRRSPLRTALILAGQKSQVATLEAPETRFVKRNDAELSGALSRAQQAAARIEPRLIELDEVLRKGEVGRKSEDSPRWLAGFDLARGRVLAHKVRAETYNAMLAHAKRGMNFQDPNNNTWVLVAADEVSVGSKWEREANEARQLLQSVVDNHSGTPWAILAAQELKTPIGWVWKEEYTELAPPPENNGGNNNNPPPPPADDQLRMLQRKPVRDIPRL